MSTETQEKSKEQQSTDQKSKEKPNKQNKQNKNEKKNQSQKSKPKPKKQQTVKKPTGVKLPPKNKLKSFVFHQTKPARKLGSGGVLRKTKALGRLIRWPKYVKLQRQKKNIDDALEETTSYKHFF